MNILDNIIRLFGYVKSSDSKKIRKRTYDAAKVNRLNNDWRPGSYSSDYEIYTALVNVRNKARDLANNNEIGKKFLRLCRKNIPGPYGFALKMNIKKKDGTSDDIANNIIKNKFLEWCKRGNCDITGRLTFRNIQHIGIMSVARDGELLVKKIYDDSPFGFRLQILEPDLLDETINKQIDDNRFIRLGVELDKYRKPLAYHIKTAMNSNIFDLNFYNRLTERIPAWQIYHYFDQERAFQTRGISWLVASMERLRMIGGTDEAAIYAMRIGASKMGFFHSSPNSMDEEYRGNNEDEEGNLISSVAPGEFEDIGNKQFTPFDPKYPDAAYDPTMKSFGKRTASGLDVGYHWLFNDMADANLSSIRWAFNDERATWQMLQEDYIENFIEPIFRDWLESAILQEQIIIPGVKDPMLEFDRLNQPYFIGRTWAYMDPETDTNAKMNKLKSGLTSLIREHAENGDDTEDIFKEIAEVQRLAEKYGVTLNYEYKGKQGPPALDNPIPKNGKKDKVLE